MCCSHIACNGAARALSSGNTLAWPQWRRPSLLVTNANPAVEVESIKTKNICKSTNNLCDWYAYIVLMEELFVAPATELLGRNQCAVFRCCPHRFR